MSFRAGSWVLNFLSEQQISPCTCPFVVGLLAIFIQLSPNRLLFRGYIMQFARGLTTNRELTIVMPAIVYAAPHLPNLFEMGQPTYGILIYLIYGYLYG